MFLVSNFETVLNFRIVAQIIMNNRGGFDKKYSLGTLVITINYHMDH